MKTNTLAAGMAAVITAVLLASTAHAQTKGLEGWQPRHQEPDPAKRVPQAADAPRTTDAPAPAPAVQAGGRSDVGVQAQATPAAPQAVDHGYEDGRGGAFIGIKGGRGEVYDGVDQSALELNAGYRWQAGAVALVGIEVAGGRLDATTEDGIRFGEVDYASIGVNARFNFGRTSPVYGLVRAGYWSAEEDDFGVDVDGGYFGLGLGVDLNRHVNLSLTYTNHVYFDDYDSNLTYEDINRADTLMFGAEVRF